MDKFIMLSALCFGVLAGVSKTEASVNTEPVLKRLQAAQNSPWDPGGWETKQNSKDSDKEPRLPDE